MPNRILREGILSSERVDQLSAPAEVFYRRLMSVVDDFGRYYAKLELLCSACFPLRPNRVSNSDIAVWMEETRKANLLRTYVVDRKEYLEMLDFRQQVRAKDSKFPQPPADDVQTTSARLSDAQQIASACVADAQPMHTKTETYSETKTEPKKARARARSELQPLPEGWFPSQRTIDRLSAEFKFTNGDAERYVAAFRDACAAKAYRYKDFDAAFANCVRQDWPKFRNGGNVMPQSSGSRLAI